MVWDASYEEAPAVATIDIAADLSAEDQTGNLWPFLDEARDSSVIVPGTLVVNLVTLTRRPLPWSWIWSSIRTNDRASGRAPRAIETYVALARRIDATV